MLPRDRSKPEYISQPQPQTVSVSQSLVYRDILSDSFLTVGSAPVTELRLKVCCVFLVDKPNSFSVSNFV